VPKFQGFWMLSNGGASIVIAVASLPQYVGFTCILISTAAFEQKKVLLWPCWFPLSLQQSLVMNS